MSYTHAVIMTFPSWKWEEYGFCMKGFLEHWPYEVQGYALVEKPEDIPLDIPSNLNVIDFDKEVGPRVKAFEDRNKDKPIFDLGTTGNIAVQAAKFARKALAQLWVLENVDADYIHYIDADLYTHKPITMEWLDSLTSNDFLVACTPRWWKKKTNIQEALDKKQLGTGYTETGYMIWNKNHTLFDKWVSLYSDMYNKDQIFEYDAWHDCVAWDKATLQCFVEDGGKILDLGYGIRSSHPLDSGPMGKWLTHMKGQRKFVGFSKEQVRAHGDWRNK